MLAALVFDAVKSVPAEQRKKAVSVLNILNDDLETQAVEVRNSGVEAGN